jgi:hypothetical protein
MWERGHDELWMPAGELEAFNNGVVGGIRVVNAFFGDQFAPAGHESLCAVLQQFQP